MKKEFVPYEQALKLREIGFDEPCLAFWDAYNGDTHLFFERRNNYHWLLRLFNKKPKPILEITNWEIECLEGDWTVLTPTFSQAFRWFRDKYDMAHQITYAGAKGRYNAFTDDWVYDSNGELKEFFYEEAELACLEKLLETIEQK